MSKCMHLFINKYTSCTYNSVTFLKSMFVLTYHVTHIPFECLTTLMCVKINFDNLMGFLILNGTHAMSYEIRYYLKQIHL